MYIGGIHDTCANLRFLKILTITPTPGNVLGRKAVMPETQFMKKTVLTSAILFIITSVFGQRTEFRLSLNSGLFSFAGKSSESISYINSMRFGVTQIGEPYTNNPYGSKNGLSYGVSGNVRRVTKKKIIYGVDLGYEMLRSKTAINGINVVNPTLSIWPSPASVYPASGKTYLNVSFINIHPFAGYRFVLKPVHIDLTAGVDIGRCLKAKEKGSADGTDGITYKTSVDRETITTDIRPRIQLSVDYKKFGAYIGYSAGLKNYKEDYAGGTNEAYSRIFRFGVTYLLF
jgi:hypothetical protein